MGTSSDTDRISSSNGRLLAISFGLTTALALGLDQWGKHWAFASINGPSQLLEVVPGLLAGAQGRNYGAICSLDGQGTPLLRWAFAVSGFIALGMVLRWAIVLDRERWRVFDAICGGLVLGGMMGNQLDRLLLGYVRDYLILRAQPHAIFNTGDLFMVFGAGLLILSLLTRDRRSTSVSAATAGSAE